MANNVLVQDKVQASDVGALNRVAKPATDIQNGFAVVLASKSAVAGESEVWLATQPATATLSGVWLAYSPEVVVTVSGSNQYKGIDPDPRNFINLSGKTMDVFKPKVGDLLQYTVDGIGGIKSTNTFAVATDGEYQLQWAAAAVSGLSLKLIRETTQTIGTGTIGVSSVTAYQFEVVAE